MSNSDYIPDSDLEFNVWQANFITTVEAKATTWDIPADEITALKAKQAPWTAAFSSASNRQGRNTGDVRAKNDARKPYEKSLRTFTTQRLSYNPKVTNSDREHMGLNVKTDARTPSPKPVTRPTGTIDFSVRLRHTIQFVDEAVPRRKAKPDGVHGCEIWVKIGGEAPKDASELTFLATDTATPYVADFEGADAGKIAYYWLRWVNTRGEHGPWGNTLSAMIVG